MRFLIGLLRQTWAGLLVLLALTAVLGVLYPAAVWGVSRIGAGAAEGSPVRDTTGCVVGSRWVGVDPQVPAGEPDPFFHNRVTGANNARRASCEVVLDRTIIGATVQIADRTQPKGSVNVGQIGLLD